ncbi:MAG: hypothetical protein L0Y73_05060, partial [Candidatus Aminicenantes bacterium]|nr:hypothetical protein [Candidatus Aminicenantes bacterium]
FVAGALVSLSHWLLFELLRTPIEYEEPIDEIKENEIVEEAVEDKPKKIGGGEVVMENERPVFKPAKVIEPMAHIPPTFQKSSAPANLPLAPMPDLETGEQMPPAPDFEEPTDEEVKERLNRLMRGEL